MNREVRLENAIEEFHSEKKEWETQQQLDLKAITDEKLEFERQLESQRQKVLQIENLKIDLESERESTSFSKNFILVCYPRAFRILTFWCTNLG